ncbi:MAG: VOC family protein [Deltaproteobacteria bacterium]|nr:VOC family protein [Deltaproteobacteria bacterium]
MDEKCNQHGAFSWSELTTSDAAAAQKFYGTLFGWTFKKFPNPAVDYTIFSVGDRQIGGIFQATKDKPVPTSWWGYVTVDNVDETAKNAQELGGKIMVPPQDIPDVGRFCIIQDPQGAAIATITYSMKK